MDTDAQNMSEYILSQDYFSQWLGVKVLEVRKNYCHIEMPIRKEMINGLKTVHGGVTFSFAQSALAISANNGGDAAVALNCLINFALAVKLGDTLTAESVLIFESKKTGVYDITIHNQNRELVSTFRGTVYKIGKRIKDL